MIEQCYVRSGVGVAKRRREGEEIVVFFHIPWSGRYGLKHTCPAGCCGEGPATEKAKAIEKAKKLVRLLFMPPISEPAANKYTKTDPCVRSTVLVTWTFGLLRKAIGRLLGKGEDYTGPADVVEADGDIGVPRDEN